MRQYDDCLLLQMIIPDWKVNGAKHVGNRKTGDGTVGVNAHGVVQRVRARVPSFI